MLTDELNYADGVTSHLYCLLNELKHRIGLNTILMCSGGDSVQRFLDEGITVIVEKKLNHSLRNFKSYSEIILRLLNFSRKNKIRIIHSHNHYAANIAYRVSRLRNENTIHTIQTIHGIIPEAGRLPHFKADRYVAVSEPVFNTITGNKIAVKENVRLIRQGFAGIKNPGEKNYESIKVICVSRLVYEKGIDTFILAAKAVNEKYQGKVKFLIAGSGEYESELNSLNNRINAGVEFLGNVKNVTELLSRTNIFVMPTRSASEGFPMAIVEAAFTKNIIISSKTDWLNPVFKNGVDGFTFEGGNEEDLEKDLTDKIIFAIENPEESNKMAVNFYLKSQKLFSIETMVKKHLELYCECQTQLEI